MDEFPQDSVEQTVPEVPQHPLDLAAIRGACKILQGQEDAVENLRRELLSADDAPLGYADGANIRAGHLAFTRMVYDAARVLAGLDELEAWQASRSQTEPTEPDEPTG